MTATRVSIRWLALCASIGLAFAGQSTDQPLTKVKTLYVEPLSVKGGSENLRKDLVAQLRKLNTISLTANQSDADAVLSGNGEVWVKGYVSLNPRAGTSPANGTPVYAGFLSVELTSSKGDTLWSYLARPSSPSENINKDLSKRIAKQLAAALASLHP